MGQANLAKSPWIESYRIDLPGCRGSRTTVLDFVASPGTPRDLPAQAQAAEVRELAARKQARRDATKALYARVDVPRATLASGGSIPLVGLGTWKAERGQVRSAVHAALKAGYRHIDCASVYQNEEEVGEALQAALGSGAIPREELFICSKLWNSDHAVGRVRAACVKSLAALRLTYLDLYLIHWPVTGIPGPALTPSLRDTWDAMEGLVREGLVRAIGMSNFSARKMEEVMQHATIQPAVCQIEAHPYWRNDALLGWCRERGIHVTAFSPLGSPDSASIFPRKLPLDLLRDERVLAVAAACGKNAGQVLIRWALQHGTSVIPKSTSPARIAGNLQVLDWELTEEDMAALSTLPVQQRMVNGATWLHPRGPYRTMEELWDEPEGGAAPSGEQGPSRARSEGLRSGAGPAQPPHASPAPDALAGSPPHAFTGTFPPLARQAYAMLSSGARMPLLGLGTWKAPPGQVAAAVQAAVRLGYRHLDCAEVYRNEAEVGAALAALFEAGVVRREDLFITGKLWNTSHAAAAVERAARRTLRALRLDYLDLYLMHWPVTGMKGPRLTPPTAETWGAMEGLVHAGLARSIGVANFSVRKLEELAAGATIPPAVCQVEAHPYFRNERLLAHCRAAGIHLTAYSPLGSPDSAAELGRAPSARLLDDPVLAEVAGEAGRTPAQVALRWALQRGTSFLPKSTNEDRIKQNADVWDWELSEEAMAKLNGIAHQQRMVDGSFWLSEEGPYKTLSDLWDEP
uniref:NADP-dependent oxidoreductase domain-containing protein n=1 Tax=Auxenochlorella protothecoides TaxID=3075 RepID=A0A1D1ZZK1_AUXPR